MCPLVKIKGTPGKSVVVFAKMNAAAAAILHVANVHAALAILFMERPSLFQPHLKLD